MSNFHAVDYVLFAVVLSFSMGIGIFFSLRGGKQKTISEFLMGNRKMQVIPTFISLMMSFTSAIVMLGATSEIYMRGTGFCWFMVGQMIANIIVVLFVVPIIYPLRLTSINEVRHLT